MLIPTTLVQSSGAGALTLIQNQVLPGAAASVTFSSIPQTYETLVLRWLARSSAAGGSTSAVLQFNGDTGANYDYEEDDGVGTTAAAGGATGSTTCILCGIPDTANAANRPGAGEIVIPGYGRTTFYKVVIYNFVDIRDANAGGRVVGNGGGLWANTAAITSLTFSASAGNLVTGSVFSLYGIAGS